jgi:hypothetical protein
MKIFIILGLFIPGQSSCSSATPSPSGENGTPAPMAPSPSPSPEPEPALDAAAPCPTHKLRFTKETGCRNDGSVEFCLPSGDDALVARARAIAPTIQAGPLQGGRAGCDIAAETWYAFPTGEAECVERHGALVDAAWDRLCRLAALPEVQKIVPTWYE